jgi:hypothetical protein
VGGKWDTNFNVLAPGQTCGAALLPTRKTAALSAPLLPPPMSKQCATDVECQEPTAGTGIIHVCMRVCSNVYSRCAINSPDGMQTAANTCADECITNLDCSTDRGEVCAHKLGPPKGCVSKLFAMSVMAGYVLIPLIFSIIDMPISRSVQSPLLMIRSAFWYILFMPTFVSFFSAYSTQRLADVSWGQRAVEDGVDRGQQRIEKDAAVIGAVVILLNLLFAVVMSITRVLYPGAVLFVADAIMAAAGCTFVISFVSYLYQYATQIFSYFFEDNTQNTG